MDILEVKNLSYKLPEGSELLIDNINFNIKKGEMVLITGRSGTGKSMLLKCLNGIIPNYYNGTLDGNIFYKGKLISSMNKEDIVKNIGFMWQDVDYQMINMTVEDEIAFGLENLGCSREYIKKKLKELETLININLEAKIDTLSGGQKQKVAIASIIAMNQDLILLDEPLANLDLDSAIEILQFIKNITKKGKTVILVEHRLDLGKNYIDRLLYLKDKTINLDITNKNEIANFEKEKYKKLDLRETNIIENKNNEETVINLKELKFRYKNNKKNTIENINLEIKKGERIVVLGHNGSGKSTLLKVICGLNKGRKLKYSNFKVDGSVGYVFQNPTHQLFMSSVYDEVNLNSISKEYTDYILKLFNLYELKKYHPLSLSQGKKRLLAIACILSSNPDIIILDEPTIGQDYENLKLIIDIINKINKIKCTTIITVTHDIACAKSLCDRVIILNDGAIVKQGNVNLVQDYFNVIY